MRDRGERDGKTAARRLAQHKQVGRPAWASGAPRMGKWGAPHGRATGVLRAQRARGGDVAGSLDAAIEVARGPVEGR
jgi:hypothetical protein